MAEPLRAISLWQPWASGIPLGLKAIETRGFRTSHRGDIAIHAAKRWGDEQRAFAAQERAAKTIEFGLPFGAIVAVATILDVVRFEILTQTISDLERRWGNYAPGRFGWRLTDIRPLREPVPCSGKQGVWTLDPAIADAVRAKLLPAIDEARP